MVTAERDELVAAAVGDLIRSDLGVFERDPVVQPVVLELPALAAGEYEFRCAMNMIRGLLVVQPKP